MRCHNIVEALFLAQNLNFFISTPTSILYQTQEILQFLAYRSGLRDAGRRPGELEGVPHRRLLQQVALEAGDAEDALREERRDPDAGERHEEAAQQAAGHRVRDQQSGVRDAKDGDEELQGEGRLRQGQDGRAALQGGAERHREEPRAQGALAHAAQDLHGVDAGVEGGSRVRA